MADADAVILVLRAIRDVPGWSDMTISNVTVSGLANSTVNIDAQTASNIWKAMVDHLIGVMSSRQGSTT